MSKLPVVSGKELVIKVIRKGAQQVSGDYKRSWEAKPPVDTFKPSVEVVAK